MLAVLFALFGLGLYDLFVFLSPLMVFWPTINALARRIVDGFFICGVLPVVFFDLLVYQQRQWGLRL